MQRKTSVFSLLVFAFVMSVASVGRAEAPAKAPPPGPAAGVVKGPSGEGPVKGKECPCKKAKDGAEPAKDCPHMKGVDCPCMKGKDGEAKDCPHMKGMDGKGHPKDCPCMKGKDGEAKDCPCMKGMDGKAPHAKGKAKGKGGEMPKPDPQPAK